MRFLLITIIFTANIGHSQIQREVYIERLLTTCKVWGYMKYHHTNVNQNAFDMDSLLVMKWKNIVYQPSNQAFKDSLSSMVASIGSTGQYISFNSFSGTIHDTPFHIPLYQWIDSIDINPSLRDSMRLIRNVFKNESIHYFASDRIFPSFTFDSKYSLLSSFPSDTFRYLALCRYWNQMQYTIAFIPNDKLDWDAKFREHVIPILDAKNDYYYHHAFYDLFREVRDPNFQFESPILSEETNGLMLPFECRWLDQKPIVTKIFGLNHQVRKGDEWLELNGRSIQELMGEKRRYINAMSEKSTAYHLLKLVSKTKLLQNVAKFRRITGEIYTDTILLSVSYEDSLKEIKIRNRTWFDTLTSSGCKIGYINLSKFNSLTYLSILDRLWGSDHLIIDNREAHDFTFSNFSKFFVKFDATLGFQASLIGARPGRYLLSKLRNKDTILQYFQGQVTILNDETINTGSDVLSHYLASSPNVQIVGDTSGGRLSLHHYFYLLPGKLKIGHSSTISFDKNKKQITKIGVIPSHYAPNTQIGVYNESDETLANALKICQSRSIIGSIVKSEYQIYPNPASDKIYVDCFQCSSLRIKYKICDLQGRLILEGSFKEFIDLQQIKSGLYYLMLQRENEQDFVQKIIISR